jgi:hypothetical protein
VNVNLGAMSSHTRSGVAQVTLTVFWVVSRVAAAVVGVWAKATRKEASNLPRQSIFLRLIKRSASFSQLHIIISAPHAEQLILDNISDIVSSISL